MIGKKIPVRKPLRENVLIKNPKVKFAKRLPVKTPVPLGKEQLQNTLFLLLQRKPSTSEGHNAAINFLRQLQRAREAKKINTEDIIDFMTSVKTWKKERPLKPESGRWDK